MWKRTITKYQYTITAEQQDVGVYKIEYSGDMQNWNKGSNFTSDIQVCELYIRVMDTNGNATLWKYENGVTEQI